MSNISIKKLNRDHTLTIKVNITRELRIRCAIAIWLIRVASWVLGCGFHVIEMNEDNQHPVMETGFLLGSDDE
jgi:hypothetical protein